MFEIRHLSKKYGSRTVLKDVSFDVAAGELYGYVGGNGAGKTTSMRIMLGISQPDSGSVKLHGQIIDDEIRSTIGYMPEERGLYPKMTLIDQLTFFCVLHGYARSDAKKISLYWLDRLGLADRSDSLLRDLSLGNQQRVQLAAAIAHNPSALILDEPFSGLDPIAVDTFAEILKEEAQRGIPVIFSSHQLDLVERLCDRIGILKGGELVAEGTVEQLGSHIGRQFIVRSSIVPEAWLDFLHQSDPESTGSKAIVLEAVDGNQARISVPEDFDTNVLVKSISSIATLHEFSPWRPALHEIYSDKISGVK